MIFSFVCRCCCCQLLFIVSADDAILYSFGVVPVRNIHHQRLLFYLNHLLYYTMSEFRFNSNVKYVCTYVRASVHVVIHTAHSICHYCFSFSVAVAFTLSFSQPAPPPPLPIHFIAICTGLLNMVL